MPLDQRSEFLGIIVKESERLTRLINEVLDLAKLESGRISWRMEKVDLQALIRDAINSTRQLFRDRNVTVEEFLGDEPLIVSGDYDRLTQVVINLLSNAVKFCPEKEGCISIRLINKDDKVYLEVQDNGPGIPYDEQQFIFQKFHQVSDQRAGKPKGTGLGLPISERIMERHGGRIWVESEPGQGSTFKIELRGISDTAYVISPG
jgi:signal transduction histidine kinase